MTNTEIRVLSTADYLPALLDWLEENPGRYGGPVMDAWISGYRARQREELDPDERVRVLAFPEREGVGV